MGSSPSCNHDDICHCFRDDKLIKSRNGVRDISTKWIWTNNHDNSLTECLTYFDTDNQFPTHVVSLIKEHSYSNQDDFYVTKATICEEKFYSKTKQLANKRLCSKWCNRHFASNNPFTIALFDKGQKTSCRLLKYFQNNCFYLPSLQINRSPSPTSISSVKRTLHIDGCSVSVHLLNSGSNDVKMQSVQLNMLIVDEISDIKDINAFINRSSGHYVLVNLNQYKNSHETDQICRNYNIPCIDLKLLSKESMHDLFVFAIKYYWFCMVQSCSIV